MTTPESTNEFEERRTHRQRQSLGQAIADKLDVSPEGLAEMVDGCPDQIREALVEATERGRGYVDRCWYH